MNTTDLLNQLGSQPATFGWDVVCAIQADLLSDLLARNYVIQCQEYDWQNPITDSVDLSGEVSIQFSNLTLAGPLISINPGLDPQQLQLSMGIAGGYVSVVRTSNGVPYVSALQVVSAADGYKLEGVVSLQTLQGTVQNGQDVAVTITDPSSFAANLSFNMPGAETALGQFLARWLSQQTAFSFALGTIIGGENANLTPVMFQLATQIDPDDSTDPGRLLLFIATEYNPNGGSQTSLALNDIVPDGSTCTTIIAPGAFLKQILTPALAKRCQSQELSVEIKTSPYQVYFDHGIFNLGSMEFIDHGNRNVFSWNGEPNPAFSATDPSTADPMYIPLDRGWMQPAMMPESPIQGYQACLMFQWIPSWTQGFYILDEKKGATCDISFFFGGGTDGSGCMWASVDPQTNIVSFNPPNQPAVTVSHSSNSNVIGDDEKDNIKTNVEAFVPPNLAAALPGIDAQAVTSLVLAGENILSFEQVYFGTDSQDMILFGDVESYGVTISPISVLLKPSQVQQFTVALPLGDTEGVTWSCRYGQISDGLYTAPERLPAAALDVIVAELNSNKDMLAAAFVSLVPPSLTLSPDCAISYPGCALIRFVAPAAPAGVSLEFVLNPANGCGSIDGNGNYTAPRSVSTVQKVTITAIYNQQSIGESFLVLLPSEPSVVAVSPMSPVVRSGETQTFSVTDDTVTWSAFSTSAFTEMSQSGILTAPNVSQSSCVVIVVEKSGGTGYGVAVAVIEPAD